MANNVIREVEYLGEKFFIIGRVNLVKMTKLIDRARGNLSIESFSGKSGVSCQVLYDITKRRKNRNVRFDHLMKIANAACDGSGVTMEELMSANGMVEAALFPELSAYLDSQMKKIDLLPEPEKVSDPTPKPPRRKKEFIEELYSWKDTDDDYKNFIANLAYYSKDKSDEEMMSLHSRKEDLFVNKQIRQKLNDYHKHGAMTDLRRMYKIRAYLKEYGNPFPRKESVNKPIL